MQTAMSRSLAGLQAKVATTGRVSIHYCRRVMLASLFIPRIYIFSLYSDAPFGCGSFSFVYLGPVLQ